MEMDANQIHDRILAEIDKTKKRIAEYKEMTQPIAPENAIGRISRMDAINNKSVKEAGQRQAEDKLQKLQYVLSQIGKPEFGICKGCGSKIPIEKNTSKTTKFILCSMYKIALTDS